MNPAVTVVIPTRNRLETLKQALISVQKQTFSDLEIVVVDEGSTDGTSAWLHRENDHRLRVITHQRPKKLPGARNAGVRAANGAYVAFLDDDDVWAPTKVEKQLTALTSSGSKWNVAGSVVVDGTLKPTQIYVPSDGASLAARLRVSNVVPAGGSGVMAAIDALREIDGFDEDLEASEDWDCWLRLSEQFGPPSICVEPLVAYRRAPGSMSHDTARMERSYEAVRRKHPPLTQGEEQLARRVRNRYYARQLFLNGQRREAARALRDPRGATRSDQLLSYLLWVAPAGSERLFYYIRQGLSSIRTRHTAVEWLSAYMSDVPKVRG